MQRSSFQYTAHESNNDYSRFTAPLKRLCTVIGFDQPSDYDLSKVHVAIAIHYALGDKMITKADTAKLKKLHLIHCYAKFPATA